MDILILKLHSMQKYFFNVVFRYLAGVAQDSGEPVLLRIAEEVMNFN